MTKIITIGDPHIQTNNIHEINLFQEKILDLIKSESPDLIVVLGDVLHTHEKLHTLALNRAYELIRSLRDITRTIVLVGNHDAINNQIFLTEDHWMNGMKEWENVVIVDRVVVITHDNNKFFFCPYVPNGRFIEALDTCDDDWKTAKCIFAHQEFRGCKMGAIISESGDLWKDEYPPVISGHIHSKQTIGNVYYTGSALQHAFGESEKNIIAVLEFSDSPKYLLKEIDLKLPRKKTIKKNIDELKELKIPETADKLRVSVSDNYEDFKAFKKTKKYKELTKRGVKIVFRSRKIEGDEKIPENVEEEKDFGAILEKLIHDERDKYLYLTYEEVVYGKIIGDEEVVYF